MKVKIEKIVFGGAGLGRLEDPEKPNGLGASGRVVFVWNALPGEEVEFELIKKEKTHWEGVATKILNPSPARLEPKEAHYLSCSPWQIMTPEEENKWKIEMAKETYQKIGGFDCELEMMGDENIWGYRNKMEYSFGFDSSDETSPQTPLLRGEGVIKLSFFERGKRVHQCIEQCELANPEINRVAKLILAWINKHKIPMRSLKAMILRSNLKNEVIAALFIKDKLEFKDFPKLDKNFVGFKLYYSTHKSPASVPTALLHEEGQDYLTEKILDTELKYGIFSFFQINIPVFEMALKDIGKFLDKNKSVVDFYSGVGSISLPLYNMYKSAVLVDNCAEAIEFARANLTDLTLPSPARRGEDPHLTSPYKGEGLPQLQAECMPAEKMTELITSDKIIIVDPPRAGLHEDVVKRILAQKPARVIYLSCNLSTQARDIKLLSEGYGVVFTKLYNFFPRTPHVEGLVVLEITK